jgi:cyclohexyl-isocyanide hydratase
MPNKGFDTRCLQIDAIIYPCMDQLDFTGPFEVLARLPDSKFRVLWKGKAPVKDWAGLILTPETSFDEAPQLDLLVVPGGHGQQQLMDDATTLEFIRKQAAGAKFVLSVCTGALVCGAAGLLKGRHATTHWSVHHLLKYFGAIAVDARVVTDGKLVSTAGVTAGIEGALRVAALLRGDRAAQEIQLAIQYAPQPPFASGDPKTVPADIFDACREAVHELTEARLVSARRTAKQLGIEDA